jgi:hypothetical protein
MEYLARQVDKRDSMQSAGHGPVFIDKAAAVFAQQETGGFVLVGHQRFPFFFRPNVQDIGRRKVGPERSQAGASLFRLNHDSLPDIDGQSVKSLFKEKGVKQGNVKEPTTASGTTRSADDVLSCHRH